LNVADFKGIRPGWDFRKAQRVSTSLRQPVRACLDLCGLGQRDQAFESLDKAFRERSDQMIYLKVDPRLDSLRSDARFASLVLRVGIPK